MTAPAPPSAPAPAPDRPSPTWWALPIAVVGGVLGAVQSQINSRLSLALGDAFAAAAISFGTGLLVILAIAAASRPLRGRVGAFWGDLRSGAFPWPMALGGLGGASYVLAQSITVAIVGVALFIVAVVAGQTVTGLVVDQIGLGPGGRRRLTPARVVGAVLMVTAVALAMSGGISGSAPWYLLVLPVVAGVAVGLQQAVNGRVSQHTGDFMVATLGNFVVGTTALIAMAIVHVVIVGRVPTLPASPLLYLGGLIGVAFIAMAAHLAHPLGVLTLAMSTIAGQIIGSVALDAIAPTAGAHLSATTLAGAALTLVAAIVTAGVGPRRRPRG